MFFKFKLYMDNYYCAKCVNIVQARDIEEESKKLEHEKQIAEKRKKLQLEKARIRNKIADKKLLEELESEKIKQKQKIQKRAEKPRLKRQKKEINTTEVYKAKRQTHKLYFDKNTIHQHDALLYIEAYVNQLIAVEWLHGKRRIVLNSKREVRRTRAGGFSAEKFQKFVDAKKKNTIEWFIELLNKPGVLRNKYDLIKVVSRKDSLKEELKSYLRKYQR